jgi:diguanylate cyclase (GGDEF)-like protein
LDKLSLMLLVVIVGVSGWAWTLRIRLRRLKSKLAAMTYLEHRRSRIFADINSSKPLVEILEAITDLTSSMLNGVPCWCEVTDGARLGQYPEDADRLHVIQEEIPANSGPAHGILFAGVGSKGFLGIRRAFVQEMEILSGVAQLAMLAMETRKLHSELVQRSEVDLLTNIGNRRSLGERLDTLIVEAHQNASVFGLVYIDLNDFKPINDRYGHHVGDLFLQQIAQRLKKQLRSNDLLARLGGDEFGVLLPMVRTRTRVEEIVLRLEHSLKEPFSIEGNLLQGSASFGYSFYPEDGTTRESLLSAADAAMYAAKNFRKKAQGKTAVREGSSPADRGRS